MLLVSSILHTPTRGRVSLIANKKNEKEIKDNLDRSRLDCCKPCFDQNALTAPFARSLFCFFSLWQTCFVVALGLLPTNGDRYKREA